MVDGRKQRPGMLGLHFIFLQHSPECLCYDGVPQAYTGTAPGREETVWTLSRSWIR